MYFIFNNGKVVEYGMTSNVVSSYLSLGLNKEFVYLDSVITDKPKY